MISEIWTSSNFASEVQISRKFKFRGDIYLYKITLTVQSRDQLGRFRIYILIMICFTRNFCWSCLGINDYLYYTYYENNDHDLLAEFKQIYCLTITYFLEDNSENFQFYYFFVFEMFNIVCLFYFKTPFTKIFGCSEEEFSLINLSTRILLIDFVLFVYSCCCCRSCDDYSC